MKAFQKVAFFIISTLLYKMAQLYEESILEISLGDINVSFVPESKQSEGNPLDVLPLKISRVINIYNEII